MKRLTYVPLMLVLTASLLLAACGKPAPSPTGAAPPGTAPPTGAAPAPTRTTAPTPVAPAAGAPEYGGIYKMMTSGLPPSPIGRAAQTRENSARQVTGNLEQFFTLGERMGLDPMLATKWVTDPGKSVTFELRKGVKFHDGTDWNADAAKWGLEQLKKENRNGVQAWTSVSVVDEHIVRVNVSAYDLSMLTLLSEYHFESPSWRAKMGDAVADWNPMGTGPFRFKSYKEAVALEYERFDRYWGPRPYLDGYTWLYVADVAAQEAALQKGVGHLLMGANPKQALDMKALGFQVIDPDVSVLWAFPDTVNAASVYTDKRVREAVEYALDKELLAKTALLGFGAPLYQSVGRSNYWGYNPAVEPLYRKYNPAKAKELLKAAGYPNGFKTQIISRNTETRDVLVAVQDMLSQAGIQAELNLVSSPRFNELRLVGWTNGLMWNGAGQEGGDVLSSWQRHLSVTRPAGQAMLSTKRPAEWDELFSKLLVTQDPAAAEKIAQEMVKVGYETAWVIPVYSRNYIDIAPAGVHNYKRVGKWGLSIDKIWLDKKLQGR